MNSLLKSLGQIWCLAFVMFAGYVVLDGASHVRLWLWCVIGFVAVGAGLLYAKNKRPQVFAIPALLAAGLGAGGALQASESPIGVFASAPTPVGASSAPTNPFQQVHDKLGGLMFSNGQ